MSISVHLELVKHYKDAQICSLLVHSMTEAELFTIEDS